MAERHLLLLDVDGMLAVRTESGELTRTPGSWEALSQLQYRSDAVSSLATGLSEDEARAKAGDVRGAGLERYLDLDVGAYRADGADRATLVAVARRRAQDSYGCEFRVMVVTGGSVAGVARARAEADVLIAVGSGEARPDDLLAAGADHVVTSLVELVPLVLGAKVG